MGADMHVGTFSLGWCAPESLSRENREGQREPAGGPRLIKHEIKTAILESAWSRYTASRLAWQL